MYETKLILFFTPPKDRVELFYIFAQDVHGRLPLAVQRSSKLTVICSDGLCKKWAMGDGNHPILRQLKRTLETEFPEARCCALDDLSLEAGASCYLGYLHDPGMVDRAEGRFQIVDLVHARCRQHDCVVHVASTSLESDGIDLVTWVTRPESIVWRHVQPYKR